MTMTLSAPLQRALYERLVETPALAALSGRIFDDAPHGASGELNEPFITLGDETVAPWNTSTETGAIHEATVRIHAPTRGFLSVKRIAADVVEALTFTAPAPSRGHVVTHEFTGARTRREEGGAVRRVDLTFRFVIEDTPAA